MSIGDALYQYLCARPTVAAVVGNRIYPDALPSDVVLPAVKYFEVDTQAGLAHDGDEGVDFVTVQFDCYAISRTAVMAVANALRQELHGKTFRAAGVTVQLASLENQMSAFEEDSHLWRRIVDFHFGFSEVLL